MEKAENVVNAPSTPTTKNGRMASSKRAWWASAPSASPIRNDQCYIDLSCS